MQVKQKSDSLNVCIFRKISQIGQGAFANVYKIEMDDQIYAMKQIDLEQSTEELLQTQKEIHVMKALDHKNIVKYYTSFIEKSCLNIIIELCQCSLRDIIVQQPLQEKQIAFIANQILHGLDYLHSQKIIHRDIKPANILISEQFTCQLCDFGVSNKLSQTLNNKCFTSVGTPHYTAPEQVNGTGASFSADLFSLGILIIEMHQQHIPYENIKPAEIIKLVQNKQYNPYVEYMLQNPKMSKQMKDFIEILLNLDPNKRQTAAQLLKHKFIVLNTCKAQECGLIDILSRCVLNVQLKLTDFIQNSPKSSPRQFNREEWDFSDELIQNKTQYKQLISQAFVQAGVEVDIISKVSEQQAESIIKVIMTKQRREQLTSARSTISNFNNTQLDADCAEILDAVRKMH